eukprot:2717891-Amphidinium_carterae.1
MRLGLHELNLNSCVRTAVSRQTQMRTKTSTGAGFYDETPRRKKGSERQIAELTSFAQQFSAGLSSESMCSKNLHLGLSVAHGATNFLLA